MSETVNTKKVTDRRTVRYESLDETLAEAESFENQPIRTVGNWSQGAIYAHLAKTMNCSIDGFDKLLPAPARWLLTLLMKKRMLTKGLPAGFKTAPAFVFPDTSTEDGLASIRTAIARQNNESDRSPHPGFGRIDREEWNQFHLRHAELHMSFLVPEE